MDFSESLTDHNVEKSIVGGIKMNAHIKKKSLKDVARKNVKRNKSKLKGNKFSKMFVNSSKRQPLKNLRMSKANFDRLARMEMDKTKLQKYDRGEPVNDQMIKLDERRKLERREKKVKFAMEQSVRTELLLTEEPGYLEANEGEETVEYSQSDIQDAVDLTSASKRFDLILNDFGPYVMNYTRNGRFLLLGGRRGHVAAMDWISKKLMCEINVMESVHDIAWLHQETMFSVAQKKWVYFYDNQGIEIHCVKQLSDVVKLTFLPYHFLLVGVSSTGIITWLDVTMGKIIEQLHIPLQHNPACIAQHPGNALICIGQPSGVINFWSPNLKKPSITKWCHKKSLCSIAFDPRGQILATASVDRTLKLWDARNLKGPLQQYKLRSAPNWISLSQRGYMALGIGNVVEIYRDCTHEKEKELYLRHSVQGPVKNIEFCPFEDVLGIGHSLGFSSILVPGSGEANFDACELNPFQTKAQRRETEIQQLLTKIGPELITWDPTELRKVHVPSLEQVIEETKKLGYVKPPDMQIEPRYKSKKKGSAIASKRKKIMKEEIRRNHIKTMKNLKGNGETNEDKSKKKKHFSSVLDRFRQHKK